jgi:hypothetical protein
VLKPSAVEFAQGRQHGLAVGARPAASGTAQTMMHDSVLHKLFAQTLNVVVIVKTNTETGARAHAILFSSDRNQTYDQIIAYYTLRFQIEFNFRDAK